MKKTKLFWLLPAIAITFLFSACASPTEIEDEIIEDPENGYEQEEIMGENLEFETVSHQTQSNYQEDGKYVIRDQAALENLWENFSDEEMPEVDFENQMMLAVFMGEKPTGGFSVEITEIIETEDSVEVLIKETIPGEDDMVTTALTYPEHIVISERCEKEVIFTIQ